MARAFAYTVVVVVVLCICSVKPHLEVFPLHWHLGSSGRSRLSYTRSHTPSPLSYHYRKDAKKVTKLEAQIPYHQGRGNTDEVDKIKNQIESIWAKARAAEGL